MKNVSRRNFLKNSVGLTAGAASMFSASSLVARRQEPQMQFPSTPRERLAVSTWPFRTYMEGPKSRWRDPKLPGMVLTEFPAMVAKKFDLYNVELLADHFPSTDKAYLGKLRTAVEKAGSHIVDIPVGATASFYDPFAVKRQEAIDYGKK